MNLPRKSPKFIKLILTLFMFTLLMLTGCTGGSVQVEFPINHPANPEAFEAEFTQPPNPFQTDVAGMEREPEADSMMKHKTNEESGKQHMDHNMGTKKGSELDSDSTKKSGHGEDDNQHKGHSQ
jgi:hypothetical protein